MRFNVLGITALLCTLLLSCQNGIDSLLGKTYGIDERAEFCDVEPAASIPQKYAVVVISDMHLDKGSRDMEDFLSYIAAYPFAEDEKAAFCIVLGDIADHGYDSEYATYLAFRSRLEALGMQVFSTAGNHDTYASGDYGRKYMDAIAFSTFFRIKIRGISFYVIDTADGTLGYAQLHKLEEELADDGNRKITFSHYPPYSESLTYSMLNDTESAKLLSLYAKHNVVFAFSGHTHVHEEKNYSSFRAVTVGSILNDIAPRNFAILFIDTKNNSFRCESIDF